MWQQSFVLALLIGIVLCLLQPEIKPSYVFAAMASIAF